ncbi:hypothetical protein A1O3_06465 [Capronia epimyces CBS 606.96]|uniref:Nuclear speckle splicing regulatory protein 1 N-terminal domain-containing protein n=1 Tax=Capronia epimyces CBS 606.96 TaxID=1182542 RepID=W9XQ25_9EURO|nr:uncharacterized protein A1O3_06465 [Capronia epimyces CBS 606.96]EXJ82652.1 hypothetical protein A1O3_06465 [Capronia epimyces CBS 606.96]
MPALAFGLNAAKSRPGISKPSQKRKAFFDEDEDIPETNDVPQYGAKKPSKPLRPITGFGEDDEDDEPPRKSPQVSQPGLQSAKVKGTGTEKYTNLSALRSARLQDEEAAKIDSSVYDYDAAYETFHAPKEKKSSSEEQEFVPKYMGSLLQSAEVRKRDQLRAREKLLKRERDAEGDEFADKEKFVTEAYKKQQEEIKRMEEEEKKREEAEEERRRKGGGMTDFHKRVLQKDEERMRQIQQAEEEAARRKASGVQDEEQPEEEQTDAKIAEELIQKGARIVVNDEGEIVDKRQLLSAGLNVAAKKPGKEQQGLAKPASARPQEHWKSSKAQDSRVAQRERQSRMVERQVEEMAAKQREAEMEEERARQETIKSRLTETDKMGARERYLQRKKEREEEAKKKKEAGG